MNDPDDEGTLLDQGGVCLFQPIEKHADIHSMATPPLQASVTPAVACRDKHPIRLFRAQMHEELSTAKQKLCATVMAQRATPA